MGGEAPAQTARVLPRQAVQDGGSSPEFTHLQDVAQAPAQIEILASQGQRQAGGRKFSGVKVTLSPKNRGHAAKEKPKTTGLVNDVDLGSEVLRTKAGQLCGHVRNKVAKVSEGVCLNAPTATGSLDPNAG